MTQTIIDISRLRTDGGTQLRARGLDAYTLTCYSERYREYGMSAMPAIAARYDGESYWVSDGHHRMEAAVLAGLNQILVDVRDGTLKDATIDACAANKNNGLPRCADTIRNSVLTALSNMPDATGIDIAKHVGVHPNTVYHYRNLGPSGKPAPKEEEKPTGSSRNGTHQASDSQNKPSGGKPSGDDEPHRNGTMNGTANPVMATSSSLPPHLRDIFADPRVGQIGQELHDLLLALRRLKVLSRLAPYHATHPWIDSSIVAAFLDDIDAALAGASEHILSNLPDSVCPACHGDGGKCQNCTPLDSDSGCGYVPAWRLACPLPV